ncbi:MAG: DNA polymerase III subunit alpha [Gammaproteobacteria bacterium]|nr:DNA polymerase III subunit alpha [Gammaproteobacteria bacterium]
MAKFIHLHLHTEYSITDGLVRIPELIAKARELNMPAVAVTDQSNLFAMVKFYRAALASGIKPIMGADVWIENVSEPQNPFRLILFCQNDQGYHNLSPLISKSYLEGQKHGKPTIQRSWLTPQNCEGLIALSGGMAGDIGRAILAEKSEQVLDYLIYWKTLFPNRFYLEMSRVGHSNEEIYIQSVLHLAQSHQIPVVATNLVCFLNQNDFEAHEARICINSGWLLDDPKRPRAYTEQQYLRSSEEMQELFADIPEALENTVEIAKRCNLQVSLGQSYLPQFPVPEGITTEQYLEDVSRKGLEERLKIILNSNNPDFAQQRKPYDERLKFELDVIHQMGFSGYFLIVADFIQWSKDHGIPVGPGRGSGAGSLVAYALKITDVDPLTFDLLFERFLNPERISMPDFDIDFCMVGRDRVIDYVARKYGRESVSQIITYGTMAARGVVRDVGRVLGHPYGFVDKLAKLIPFALGMTLDQALEQEESLKDRYKKEPDVHHLIDLARKLEGLVRNVGKHAGGVVISPSLLTDFTPLYCEPDGSNLISQFDKDDVDAVGLVKFDFLGLRTLTIINWAVQTINEQRRLIKEPPINIAAISLNDPKVFQLLKSCQTTAVFQLESRGLKELIKRLQPDCFEDILALVALYRPGPLQSGMVDDFIARKHGQARVQYPHPALEPVLKSTYGVILYQEQVMQIAQVLAGYTLGQADLLRKAMGKKKPEVMAKQRITFIMGAVDRGLKRETAEHIFDLMEKFAGYGFNKAHSAAYALLSYQTAWLKAHYPAEFMAAVLSSDMDHTDKLVRFIDECRAMKLKILPPDINRSVYPFIIQDGCIVYGLGAIKGVGEAAVENIIQARNEGGAFQDFFDFCKRVDLHKVNKRTLEALIKSGTMDSLGNDRAVLLGSIKNFTSAAEKQRQDNSLGQGNLFGAMNSENDYLRPEFVRAVPWSEEERLGYEHETLGFYLSGHPMDRYREELRNIVSCSIAELKPEQVEQAVLAGFIVAIRKMVTKRGDPMAFVRLNDGSDAVEIAVFSESYEKYQELLKKGQLLIIECDIAHNNYSGNIRINANTILTIAQAREKYAKHLLIPMKNHEQFDTGVTKLAQLLKKYPGKTDVIIQYENNSARIKLPLGSDWKIYPSDEFLDELQLLLEKSLPPPLSY